MLDYKEQIQSVYQFLKRSEEEQKYPYAYEICLLTGIEQTALTSRTSGSGKFSRDIDSAVEKAKQSNGMLRVEIFGGKSPNARKLNSYTINVSGIPGKQTNKPVEKEEIQTMIKEEINQSLPATNFSDLGNFLGSLSGNKEGTAGLEGLLGIVTTIAGNNTALEKANYQKQLDDFKYETRYNMLQEKYGELKNRFEQVRVQNITYEKENRELKDEVGDLEERLTGYTSHELAKRVATGAIANIGSRILAGSPKTAELLGISPQELKGALGVLDDNESQGAEPGSNPSIEVSEVESGLTPEEKQTREIIQRLSDTMKEYDLEVNTKIISIVAVCLEHIGLLDDTLRYVKKKIATQRKDQ
jgi:hypothetical protein